MQERVLSETPLVSVIILSWNALPLLQRFLPSVVATSYDNAEIILADNASTDGSAQWAADTYPHVRIVRHADNYGFCKGNNLAIAEARGDFVVLLNNDVEVDRDWLQPMVAQMVSDPRVGAVQPKLLKWGGSGRFEYAGAAGGFIDRWGFPFARGRVFDSLEEDKGQYDEACDILWATGAAVMLRASALQEVGLLDERFFMHMEEIDLCWRLKRHGYRVVCEPASVVQHVGGASLAETSARKTYFNFRNNLLTLYKNLSGDEWRRVRRARVLFDTVAAVRSAVTGRPRDSFAIWRGHRDAASLRQHYPQIDEPRSPVGEIYARSIVIDHFLRRRRRFSDLSAENFTVGGGQR
jgi:GT2 family glycosyltransferase